MQALRRTLKQAKEDYRKKVERKLQHNNTREVAGNEDHYGLQAEEQPGYGP